MRNTQISLSVAIAILFTNNSMAQKVQPSLPDTTWKYEVGINIAPALIFLLGAEAAQNYSLSFRMQQENLAYQIKAVFNRELESTDFMPKLTAIDSTVKIINSYIGPQKYFGLAAGMEFFNPKKKIKLYGGLDVLVRYYVDQFGINSYSYTADTITFPFHNHTEVTLGNSGTLDVYQFGIGAAIKGGVRIPIGKHFFIQPEIRWDADYLLPASFKSYGDIEGLKFTTEYNFHSNLFVSEVSVFYRF